MSTTHTTFFGKLIASIGNFLSHLLAGAQKGFNDLPKDQQDAIINGVGVADIIKKEYHLGEAAVVASIAKAIGVTPDVASGLILGIGKDLGINTGKIQDVLDHYANQTQAVLTDNGINSLWQTTAKFAASWLATGSLNWVTLSLGVIEWAYQNFIKAKAHKSPAIAGDPVSPPTGPKP